MKYDFSGYATKTNLSCADGRIIRKDAFLDNDGTTVPLVWQHIHDDPTNVLGHALLENRDDGVYAYGVFNKTPSGQHAKEMVENGDISSLSIYANRLKQHGNDVVHGLIREVSLVLTGANPGATIDNVSFAHADGSFFDSDDEAIIYPGDEELELYHSDEMKDGEKMPGKAGSSGKTVQEIFDTLNDEQKDLVYFLIGNVVNTDDDDEDDEEEGSEIKHSDDSTIADVFNSMTKEQKDVVYYLIGRLTGGEEDEDDEEEEDEDMEHGYFDGGTMKRNVFDSTELDDMDAISHSELNDILVNAERTNSLKDTFLAHGIENLDILFPEAQMVRPMPDIISRTQTWVDDFWSAIHKSPFSRIKSAAANLTQDEARARGYIKGNKKVDEQFSLLSRETTPQTIYKKQSLDRDDVVDITDIDVVAWLKQEMRMMLNEELCRAILVGDGRLSSAADKIKETNIRPIYQDADTYTIHYEVTYGPDDTPDMKSATLVDSAIIARKEYRGSGNPKLYATNDVITQMLLARDKIGRRLYKDMSELASALRVAEVVEVPVMENVSRTNEASENMDLLAIIVNLRDYTVGADKGGAVSLFDDFDIDFNQMKFLIETRCSGALTKPFSAIALETKH